MDIVDGNHFDKYRSRNPVHHLMMGNFLQSIQRLYEAASPQSVLEVGCGPGDLAGELRKRVDTWGSYEGTDLSDRQIEMARRQYPDLAFRSANAYQLPYEDSSFELVMGCEVLEHLDRPSEAIQEMARVAKTWLLVSVPWEPTWRIANFCRGKYIRQLGNTPGHVGHFTRRRIRRLVETVGCIQDGATPFPWTALLARIDESKAE